jgi:L-lysine exporter family protein LysE/ArgO
VSLLNPITYLDTLFVIGSNAARYSYSVRIFFVIGATVASFIWFFGLAFGAARLSKFLRRPAVLRLIDGFSSLIMWLIAGRLALHIIR